MKSSKFIENVHYYKDGDKVVFTALFHLERGFCCGNICRHCPFDPQYNTGTENIQTKYLSTQEDIVIFNSKKGYANTSRKNNKQRN